MDRGIRLSSCAGIGGHGKRGDAFIGNAFSLFDLLWDDVLPFTETPLLAFSGYSTPQFPPVDIEFDKETKDMYFTFALAGYQPDEIDVKFEENYLVLSSEIISKEKDENKAFYKKGIKKTSFSVKYAVPVTKYDTDNTEASFSDGLLKIKVPAREEIKPKQIEIKTN